MKARLSKGALGALGLKTLNLKKSNSLSDKLSYHLRLVGMVDQAVHCTTPKGITSPGRKEDGHSLKLDNDLPPPSSADPIPTVRTPQVSRTPVRGTPRCSWMLQLRTHITRRSRKKRSN